ncbi:MAG: HD-GYP domain-containing protein [Chloroflexi bacterium]|nr:HD-GYP domain-containing protein [Chloroflexota bacterium]
MPSSSALIVPRVLWGRPIREIQLLALVYAVGLVALVTATVPLPSDIGLGRLLFWILITAAAVALPVHLPGGVIATMSTAPLLATAFDNTLPQPFAVCWVAVIGTIEPRDLRRQIPWFGSLFNKLNYLLSTYAAWIAVSVTGPAVRADALLTVLQIALAGSVFMLVNNSLSVLAASARSQAPVRRVFAVSIRNVGVGLVSQVPLGWLMAEIANAVGEWATLLFIVPLLLARYSFTKYTELRELFFGSVSALSQAIDAKDGFTRGHADRVSRIAGAIARQMGVSEREIEQIELAALLHDIGKIGVEDRILLKPSRLDPHERALMQRHAIYGASILEPSSALRPLVPLVLHHHENFDGTGYPEGLKGERIPLGSRIIIVADAYEAMTADRVYRKAPGHDKAMEQLNRHKGTQFDPKVVRALDQLIVKEGAAAFEHSDLPAIEYETLAELRRRLAREPVARDAVHAG